jgi:NAD(P)-dependent dehydrogenase (short-subunit alcohol dehydrogenase family)
MQVRNHNIVVTGGASGLGREVAIILSAAGASIAIVDINEAGAADVAREIAAAGGRAEIACGDLTRKESAHGLFRRAASSLGRINGLVNCAGVYPRRPILEISDEDWDFSFSVNLRGLYHMSVAAIEHMRQQGGGRIVNVASIDAF